MKYTNEEFKNLICIELGKHHLAKGNIWAFQKYNPFRARMYPPISVDEFKIAMDTLVKEGLFTTEEDSVTRPYFLTENGEKWLFPRKDFPDFGNIFKGCIGSKIYP